MQAEEEVAKTYQESPQGELSRRIGDFATSVTVKQILGHLRSKPKDDLPSLETRLGKIKGKIAKLERKRQE